MRTIPIIFVLLCAAPAQQVIGPWQIPCSEEIVQSNLDLQQVRHIFGKLTDLSGATLEDSKVLLRRQDSKGKFFDYRSAVTDKEGRFDLKTVEAGKYRFLPGPNRGWKQPKRVTCTSGSECEVKLILELNPTDQPYAGCPLQ